MRRSKKSLGRAILVSLLSASMVMPTSVYAADYIGVNDNVEGDVTNGIYADDKSNVTITGSASAKEEYEDDSREDNHEDIIITDGSHIAVKGDVDSPLIDVNENSSLNVGGKLNSSELYVSNDSNLTVDKDIKTETIINDASNVSVGGNVIIKNDDPGLEIGVDTFNGTTTIDGNVDVTTAGSDTAVTVESNLDHKSDIHIKKDINMNSSVGSYSDAGKIYFNNSTGLSARTQYDGKVNAETGNINVKSDGTATGIVTSIQMSTVHGSGAAINVTTGAITVEGKKKIEEGLEGDLENSESTGIHIYNLSGKSGDNVNILVKGDLKSSELGVAVYNFGDKNTKTEANVAVDGTINTKDAPVYIFNRYEDNNSTLNLTAWKIEGGTDNNVIVKNDDQAENKNVFDEEESKKQSEKINYIIRHDGTISLTGTRLVSVNGSEFQTARETEKLTIHVKVDDEKKYRVDRVEGGSATATKNSDGSWTLVVPKNGGVDIRAVLVAIEQNENQGSSGSSSSGLGSSGSSSSSSGTSSSGGSSSGGSSSGGGSSSTRPGVNNASTGMMTTTPEGATVQTNVTKNDNSTVTTAAVRIGTTTANVSSAVSDQNGTKVTVQNADGNLAGASFKGVGQISADGATLVKEDGTTAKMAPGMLLSIENADGTSVGCFMDATGKTIATGNFEVYYMLGTDGKLHAHFVNPQGYFMTGIQVINGMTVTFNATGEMVSVL